MAYKFKNYDPQQLYLLPPSLDEWVDERSLARFVSEAVDTLAKSGKLEVLFSNYHDDSTGAESYHPQMMVKVLIYGYCVGIVSSRKIEEACRDLVPMRFLAANQHPDHRTIANFRVKHHAAFGQLFIDVLRLCKQAGLVKLGRVALDGTKVAGNAALSANKKKEYLKTEVERLIKEAAQQDKAEDDRYGGMRKDGNDLPPSLRKANDRLSRFKEALRQLEEEEKEVQTSQEQKVAKREQEEHATGKKKRGRKLKKPQEIEGPRNKANTTDPDSRILKDQRGYLQGYNAQAMSECGSQVIVACDVTDEENDQHQLIPMLKRCEEQTGQVPQQTITDAGYCSEANIKAGKLVTELFVATSNAYNLRKGKDEVCAVGRIPDGLSQTDLMTRKLITQPGKGIYKLRKSTIEPVFGQMDTRGLRRFLLRGMQKAKLEWTLWCTTHNILKLWRSGWVPA